MHVPLFSFASVEQALTPRYPDTTSKMINSDFRVSLDTADGTEWLFNFAETVNEAPVITEGKGFEIDESLDEYMMEHSRFYAMDKQHWKETTHDCHCLSDPDCLTLNPLQPIDVPCSWECCGFGKPIYTNVK